MNGAALRRELTVIRLSRMQKSVRTRHGPSVTAEGFDKRLSR
jgi:hypothetical protein